MTKPKRPYATNTKRRAVTITEPDWQALKKLGDGNASAGIRQALRQTEVKTPADGPRRPYK